MTRRPFALATTAMAAALVWASGPARSRADSITPNANGATAEYRLTTSSDLPPADPNSQDPQVVAKVVPMGGVVPPLAADGKTQESPLTILDSSNGFDQGQLVVGLKDVSNFNGSGSPAQLFGLSFFGDGLKKSGQLDFALNLDKSLSSPPVLESQTPGVSITALQTATPPTTTTTTPPPSTSSAGTPGGAQVPEPMSVALWSVLAGAGLLRARATRRCAA